MGQHSPRGLEMSGGIAGCHNDWGCYRHLAGVRGRDAGMLCCLHGERSPGKNGPPEHTK